MKLIVLNNNAQYGVREILKVFYPNENIIVIAEMVTVGKFAICELIKDEKYVIRFGIYDGVKVLFEEECEINLELMKQNFIYNNEAKFIKFYIKKFCYEALSKYLNKKFSWGTLTGIRPSKIVHKLYNKNLNAKQIKEYIKKWYHISESKADLLVEVAKKEKSILDKLSNNSVGLYIGIPFCKSKCVYCSFTSETIANEDKVQSYLKVLRAELKHISENIIKNRQELSTIYIGGGTPTVLSEQNLQELLEYINTTFDISKVIEFTVEAGRPDSINKEKLKIIKNNGVSRISINPQTMNDDILKNISRKHDSKDIIKAFEEAREIGFNNINMDLIAGLPGDTKEGFNYTLNEIIKLYPENITIHNLAYKKGSNLINSKDEYKVNTYKELENMINISQEILLASGIQPYYLYRQKNMIGNFENVGYSIKDFEGIYNIQIMCDSHTIYAAGAGSVTKIISGDGEIKDRSFNPKDVQTYINKFS